MTTSRQLPQGAGPSNLMTTTTSVAPHRRAPATVKPLTPILRKTSSVLGNRKRDDSEPNDDDPTSMSSPTKRRKTVMFNENLNQVKEIEGKSLDDAKREVRQALSAHAAGDSEDYDRLKELFSIKGRTTGSESDEDDDEDERKNPRELLLYVIALTAHVPLLGKSCSGLIRAVLRYSWLGRDDVFVRAYIQFMAALASAQGSCLSLVLTSIIERFKEGSSSWAVEGYPAIDKEAAEERLHTGLEYLLNLFPGAVPITTRLLGENFPFADDSKRIHIDYVNSLLRINSYAPKLERDVMELILSRVCELDVGMALDLEDDDDTTRAIMVHVEQADLHENEDDEDDGSDADSVMSDETDDEDEDTKHVLTVSRKIQTLDAILVKLIEVYTRPFSGGPDSPEAVDCFENLLSDFCNVILPNLKSRHIQFLLFLLAQKSRRFTEMFIGTLLTITFDSNRADVVKQAAAAYLASFVARGARVPKEFVQMTATTLLNYLDHFKKSHEKECRGPDLRRYAQYYSFMQGLLYIFCFRWADFVDEEASSTRIDRDDLASYLGADLTWMSGLKERLQVHLYRNKLNPLKVLSPVIVQEFARLCHHLNLMYIYPLIEQNKSIQLAHFNSYSTGGASRDTGIDMSDEQWHHLEPFFPFDPYQLPASRRLLDLEDTYLAWRSIPGLDRDDEDDDSEGDADDDDDEDIEEDTATDDDN